ncbi:RNA recognition motif domain-containing protein [Kamptonema formosum]|uniref:RNA recognition motif domain-containing protein n=1 Tax=Kamptonema formosum TaxID=331992 RepID=UPI0003475924|nr:RNA-binding protein [Oscillatoria sp. PCC 10802]
MSIRLYVGNLPKEIDRKELQAVFAEAGEGVTAKVITDRKTGKCRGFGFVTVKTEEEADQIIEKYNGYLFKENPLKIEKALPRSKGKGEEDHSLAAAAAPATAAPVPAPVVKTAGERASERAGERSGGGGGERAGGGGGGGERAGGRRGGGQNKSRRGAAAPASSGTTASSSSEATQPDPRWAQELEKLKQMLAAQASNP